jgi:hypothetical protein
MSESIPLSDLQGGANAASFPTIGTKYVGRVVKAEWRPQTDPTGQPKKFSSGQVMTVLVITIEMDNGEQTSLWAKGGSNFVAAEGTGTSMLVAIGAAVEAAGAKALDPGGLLAVAYTGNAKKTDPMMNPAKLYGAQYSPPQAQPAASVPLDLFSS